MRSRGSICGVLADPRLAEIAGLLTELAGLSTSPITGLPMAALDAEHTDTGLSVRLSAVTQRWQQAGSPADGPKYDAVIAARRVRAAHRRANRDLLAAARAARRASSRQAAQRRKLAGQIRTRLDTLITDHQAA